MTIRVHTYWLQLLLILVCLNAVSAQTTLSLYYGDPAASPDEAFDGNVFQVGSQIGDAAIYAKFGGTGTKSFQIDSPGENKTVTVDKDGFFFIRPVTSMVVDQSRIKNFTGTVTGSVSINVKPLIITTLSANVANNVSPGSEITVSYRTGAGTFPVDLVLNSFGVQLLNANGNLVSTLQNTVDQYSGREKQGASFGGTRYIKATIPANTAPGTYQVRVVTRGLQSNVSGSPSSSFTVRADTPPSLTATSLGNVYCAGSTVSFPFSTAGTFAATEQFRVQRVDASGNTLEELAGSSTVSPVRAVLPATLPTGTYRFKVFASVANVVSNIINVSVAALPTLTISGNSATSTGGKAAVQLVLTGTPPWSFSYTDYNPIYAPNYLVSATTSGSPFIINPTFVTSTIYDKSLIKGFRDSGCGTSEFITGSAQISINQTTITTGTLAGTYCPGSSLTVPFTLSSPLPADVLYRVQLSDANGNFQSGLVISNSAGTSPITATIPPGLAPGTGYRIRVVSFGTGTVDYSNLTSSTSSSLTLSRPDAPRVSDVSFCVGTSTGPLSATGVNLTWYLAGSTQPLAGAPVPPGNQSSVYTVSQTINGCASNLATVNVTAKPLPAAPAVSSIALCQGAQGQFTSTIPNALWYTASTGGTGSPQPPALNNQAVGDQIVYVTQTVDGCESPRATVKATVNPIPAAPVPQTPAPVCQYATASALTASGQGLTWYGQSGAIGATAIPDTRVAGTFSYSVSQRISGCESPQATVSVTVRQAPNVPVASSPSYCVGETPRSLTATGSNIRWYTTESGGTSTATIATFPTDRPALLSYYVTQTDNFGCESQRLLVPVTVLSAPSAPSVTANQTVCQFSKVSPLTASPSTGLLWQGPGIAGSIETAPTPNTLRAGTYTYVVTQKVGSCTSPASQITYTVRQQPEQPKTPDYAFCIGNPSTPLTATATGRLTWYKTMDHSDGGLAQIIPNTSSASTNVYYVTQTDNFNCESANDTVVVRVSAKSTARLSGDDIIYQGDSTAIRIRFTGDGPWSFIDWQEVPRTTNDSLYVRWVKPTKTQAFAIKNLNSSCGAGAILNSYSLTVLVPLAIQPTPEPLFLNAYPNPSTGELNVDWHSPKKQTVTLQLINADGKVIEQVVRQATTGSQTEHFQLGSQPTGTYILNITTANNGKLTRRIVKQ